MPDKLDDKLREIILGDMEMKLTIARIKQAFADEGYLPPEQAEKIQELINQMAKLIQVRAKLPVIVREVGTMTGQEWYDKFRQNYVVNHLPVSSQRIRERETALEAAKKVSGL